MALHRATRGFVMRSVPRGITSNRGAPSVRDRVRDPRPPLHVVDVEPGAEVGTSLCGRPDMKVIDDDWSRGLGGCSECRAAAHQLLAAGG